MLTCAYCGETFERPNTMGPTPRYCRPAHRQRAFEERRLGPFLDAVPDGWAKVDGGWVQVAKAEGYEVTGPGGIIEGAIVLVAPPTPDHIGPSSDIPENTPQGQL